MGIIGWLVLGLIAGFLASVVMKGGGYGIIGDIIVGVVGALIGGFVFSLLARERRDRLQPLVDAGRLRRGLHPDRHPARRQR